MPQYNRRIDIDAASGMSGDKRSAGWRGDEPAYLTSLAIPGAPADVRLWRLELALRAPLPADALALLDAGELARLDRFHRHEDKVRFARTRAALKRLLAGNDACASIRLAYTSTGRPVWPGGSMQFNVAHSGALALIVISDRRAVGVDVELRAEVDVHALSSMVLTPDERAALRPFAGAAKRDAFYRYWVCKEAALKATGQGITQALQRIEVHAGGADAEARRIRCRGAGQEDARLLERLELRLLTLPADYAGAVAWASGDGDDATG
ncbi:4'-phosphopantetheinyl transferase domain-containing protein [Bordetella sputigena]|uniref:4'-phosphopantetheinyl transferase family protein n=1 Tax=Bordetella sputigena TaxID=1416810 RepID=UPI0039EE340A